MGLIVIYSIDPVSHDQQALIYSSREHFICLAVLVSSPQNLHVSYEERFSCFRMCLKDPCPVYTSRSALSGPLLNLSTWVYCRNRLKWQQYGFRTVEEGKDAYSFTSLSATLLIGCHCDKGPTLMLLGCISLKSLLV